MAFLSEQQSHPMPKLEGYKPDPAVLPVSPVVGFVELKVRDVHVVSLPGTLVIGQVFPLDQVVVQSLLVHADREGHEQDSERRYRNLSHTCSDVQQLLPVVYDALDHHPLGLDAVSVVFVLQHGVLWVFGPPLLALSYPVLVFCARAVIQTGGFVHVCLPLVVSVHHRVEDLQLGDGKKKCLQSC